MGIRRQNRDDKSYERNARNMLHLQELQEQGTLNGVRFQLVMV